MDRKTQLAALAEKLDFRLKLAINCEQSEARRAVFYQMCSEDWKFFVNNAVYLQDPEATNLEDKNIPFLLYGYQEEVGDEIVKAIESGYDFPVEKSRNLGVTWLVLAIFLWGWHFHEWELLIGSRKFEEVDKKGDPGTLFEKLRYMIGRLPEYVFPHKLDHFTDKMGVLRHPKHNATIAGEANNADFGRSDRRKAIFLDEFASWESTDKAAWQSCGDTAKCRIPVSTPNSRGTDCFFYKLIMSASGKNRPYGRLHWSDNPRFNEGLYEDESGQLRSPWYDEKADAAADLSQIAQEQDINYDVAAGGRVFPGWSDEVNMDPAAEYDPQLPLYIAWDFGLDQTAMLWIQPDRRKGLYNIIDEYVNDGSAQGTSIYHYIDILDAKPYKKALHFGDPQSGENRSITSGQSPKTILRQYGITFRSKRTRIKNRVMAARNLTPGVRVNPDCVLTVEMFRQWRLRRPKSGSGLGQVPEHSEHSHIGEAWTYFTFNFSRQKANIKLKAKTVVQPSSSGITL